MTDAKVREAAQAMVKMADAMNHDAPIADLAEAFIDLEVAISAPAEPPAPEVTDRELLEEFCMATDWTISTVCNEVYGPLDEDRLRSDLVVTVMRAAIALDRTRSAREAAPIAAGVEWKLVPLKPTRAMTQSAERRMQAPYVDWCVADVWREMLAAAPSAGGATGRCAEGAA